MRQGIIAAGLFLLVFVAGAFLLPGGADEEPAPVYDELQRNFVVDDVAEEDARSAKPATPPGAGADIVIHDNYFVGMVTDMTTNMRDYEGKTVRYEGFVRNIGPELESQESFAVCRMFYCCGEDAYFVGFSCDKADGEIPGDDAWVTVTGVLGIRSDAAGDYPYLRVTAMSLLPKPGETYVYR